MKKNDVCLIAAAWTMAITGLSFAVLAGCCAQKSKLRSAVQNNSAYSLWTSTIQPESEYYSGVHERLLAVARETKYEAVHFDFASDNLSDAAFDSLERNATNFMLISKLDKKERLVIEGHCDDRGGSAYNLALGQRRANRIFDWYMERGINPQSMMTITYGKEVPVCEEETPECWAKNRRGVTLIRE